MELNMDLEDLIKFMEDPDGEQGTESSNADLTNFCLASTSENMYADFLVDSFHQNKPVISPADPDAVDMWTIPDYNIEESVASKNENTNPNDAKPWEDECADKFVLFGDECDNIVLDSSFVDLNGGFGEQQYQSKPCIMPPSNSFRFQNAFSVKTEQNPNIYESKINELVASPFLYDSSNIRKENVGENHIKEQKQIKPIKSLLDTLQIDSLDLPLVNETHQETQIFAMEQTLPDKFEKMTVFEPQKNSLDPPPYSCFPDLRGNKKRNHNLMLPNALAPSHSVKDKSSIYQETSDHTDSSLDTNFEPNLKKRKRKINSPSNNFNTNDAAKKSREKRVEREKKEKEKCALLAQEFEKNVSVLHEIDVAYDECCKLLKKKLSLRSIKI